MDTLIYPLAFLFLLGIIVFVHEWGHHIVARLCGVRVVTFSLGFGKRIWGFMHRGTDYRISIIPLGGYVRMGGEMPEEHTGDPADFLSKPRWQRILIYSAGPAMNVVLSLTLTTLVFMHGIDIQALQELSSEVGVVEKGSAAEQAGLLVGDRIVKMDGKSVDKWKDVGFIFATSPNRPVEVEYLRGEQVHATVVTPIETQRDNFGDAGVFAKGRFRLSDIMKNTPAKRAGFQSGDEPRAIDGRPVSDVQEFVEIIKAHTDQEITIQVRRGEEVLNIPVTPEAGSDGQGRIGVGLGFYRKLAFGEAVVASVAHNIDLVRKTGQILGKLFTHELSARGTFSGPIEIGRISGEAAKRGFKEWIFMVGFLSISIGLMNLLPIPLLDGGHITILLVESLMQRDISMVTKERIAQVGFVMLMLLMAMVFYFDMSKNGLLPGS